MSCDVAVCFIGIWGVGLAADKCELDVVPQGHDTHTWVLRSDGTVYHNNEVLHTVDPAPSEGDIVVRQFCDVLSDRFLYAVIKKF